MKYSPMILLLGLLTSGIALSTTFAPQEFPDSVRGTPVIIRGKVGMSYSDWGHDADGVRRVYTFYEVQGPEGLKGDVAAQSVMIRELGGTKDGVGLVIDGTASFEKGEDVVVFLRDRNSEGTYDVNGMMMGKYDVVSGSDGHEYLSGPGLLGQNNPSGKKWSLDDLRQLIRNQEQTPDRKGSSLPLPQKSVQPLPVASASAPPSNALESSEAESSQNSFLIYLAGLLTLGGLGVAIFMGFKKRPPKS
ncbi:MAG: hypothetical protein HYX41_01495 [Bdellovibrio sp.]|nr:hypothetical protein [Bdellovibrio sp.]